MIKRINLITIILILFSGLIIFRNIHESQNKRIALLKEKIKDREEREITLKKIQVLEKKIEEYKENFPKRDVFLLIEELTKNAQTHNIKVSSIKPEQEIIYENSIEQPIAIDLLSSYHNLRKFLAILEKNPQVKIQEIKLSKIESEEVEDLRIKILISVVSFK